MQFSLRTVLILMLASVVCCWWFSPGSKPLGWHDVDPFTEDAVIARYYARLSGAVVIVVAEGYEDLYDSELLSEYFSTYAIVLTSLQAWCLDIGVVASVLLISGAVIVIPLRWRKRRQALGRSPRDAPVVQDG